MQQHQAPRLPDEIWGLIVKALTRDGDENNDLACSSLVALARASMKFASLALPELYSIARILFAYEAQDYYSSQPDSTRRIWARLWRSLLESCLGRTLFPYFLWVTRWDVGLLYEQIESIHVDYLDYFGHLLEGYESRHDGGRLVDRHAVTHNIVKMLADAMSKAANDGKRSRMVSLTTGNGNFDLSPSCIAAFVSASPMLTKLDCSNTHVLNGEVGSIIRASCPGFKDLWICLSGSSEDQLPQFVQNLEPHTLESVYINIGHSYDGDLFTALAQHCRSLRSITLVQMGRKAQSSLVLLQNCRRLERVYLSGDDSLHREAIQDPETYTEIVAEWLSNCSGLKEIALFSIPFVKHISTQICKSPLIRLESISLEPVLEHVDDEFYEALRQQTELRSFLLHWDSFYPTGDTPAALIAPQRQLAHTVSGFRKLRRLIVSEEIENEDFEPMMRSLPELEAIQLGVKTLDDGCIDALAGLRKAKQLILTGRKFAATAQTARRLLEGFAADPEGEHKGLYLALGTTSTTGQKGFDHKARQELDGFAKERFGGSFSC